VTDTRPRPGVLIIDDDTQVCNILTTAFSRMGHAASFALTLQQFTGYGKRQQFQRRPVFQALFHAYPSAAFKIAQK